MKLKIFGRDKVKPLMQEMCDFIRFNGMDADARCITVCREVPDGWVSVLAYAGNEE